MTQREVYLSIKRDLRRLNMKMIVSRLKGTVWGLLAGTAFIAWLDWIIYIVMTAR